MNRKPSLDPGAAAGFLVEQMDPRSPPSGVVFAEQIFQALAKEVFD
jgi:hypothetical protein